jgi:hypothetical protein
LNRQLDAATAGVTCRGRCRSPRHIRFSGDCALVEAAGLSDFDDPQPIISTARFFSLPYERVFEVGSRVEI